MRGGFLKTVSACALFAVTVGALAQGGSPQYGAWGFDVEGADKATKPGDDFFRYANGAWLDKTAIPGDKPGYSLRLAMTDRVEQRLHDMMEAAAKQGGHEPKSIEGKIGAFYNSFMDESHIEALGAKAISAQLDAVRHAKSRDELAALMGRTNTDLRRRPVRLPDRRRSQGSEDVRRVCRPGRPRSARSRLLPQA